MGPWLISAALLSFTGDVLKVESGHDGSTATIGTLVLNADAIKLESSKLTGATVELCGNVRAKDDNWSATVDRVTMTTKDGNLELDSDGQVNMKVARGIWPKLKMEPVEGVRFNVWANPQKDVVTVAGPLKLTVGETRIKASRFVLNLDEP